MQAVILLISSITSYFSHHFGERVLSGKFRDIRLKFRNYQIHHSFWGVLAIILSVIFLSGNTMVAVIGYGIGNILQHKITHNRVSEKGIVFVTRLK